MPREVVIESVVRFGPHDFGFVLKRFFMPTLSFSPLMPPGLAVKLVTNSLYGVMGSPQTPRWSKNYGNVGPHRSDPHPWWHDLPPGTAISEALVEEHRLQGLIDWPEVYAWRQARDAERSRTAHGDACRAGRRTPAPPSKARHEGGQTRGRACSAGGAWRARS